MNTTTTPQLTNGREIAPGHPAVAPPARGGRTYTLQDVEIMARHAAASRMFGMDAAQAFTLMLLAQSEGLDPIQALRRFHVIQGKPAMRADAMLAEFQRQGGTIEWTRAGDDACSATFRHPVHAPQGVAVSFTMTDAVRAGLDRKEVWRAYPGAMLRARVISSGVRMVLPGVVVGIYTPEEIGDWIQSSDSPPAPSGRVRGGVGAGVRSDPDREPDGSDPTPALPPTLTPPKNRRRTGPRARSLPPDMPEGDEDDFPRPRAPRPWSNPPAPPPKPVNPTPDPDVEPGPGFEPNHDDPIPEPDDRAAAPPGAMSELRRFIRGEIAAAEERFADGVESAGAAVPNRFELANEFRVANGLVTRWIKDGVMDEADVLDANGRRDRKRMGAAITAAFAQAPDEVRAEVRDYLDGKLAKAFAAQGVRPPGDRDEAQASADEDPPAAGE